VVLLNPQGVSYRIKFVISINLYSTGFKELAVDLLDLACMNAVDEVSIFQFRYKLGVLSTDDSTRFHDPLESWTISLETKIFGPSNFFLS